MREKISIGQAQSELSSLSGFHVNLAFPDMPIRVEGRFLEAFVNLSRSPYIVLRNQHTQVFLRGIRCVFRENEDRLPVYTFFCQAPSGKPGDEVVYRVSCGAPS